MWKFTATLTHGTVMHCTAATRAAARTKRAALMRAPFVVSTSTPTR